MESVLFIYVIFLVLVWPCQWIAPAPIDAWWCPCTISYSFGTFAEMLGRLPNLSDFKIADRYLLWPVPKLKIDLSRRNASTQGRKTDLVERYQHYAIAFFVKTVILLVL